MKKYSKSNRNIASVCVTLLLALVLSSCSNKTPSLDLSDPGFNSPTVTPSESTVDTELADDLWDDTDTDYVEDDQFTTSTDADTTDTEKATTDTEEEIILPEEMPEELTFIYAPNADGTTCTINTILTAPEELEIPAEIDGYTVTVLGKQAFNFSTHVQKLTLPATITKIRTGVFSKCKSLSEVHISDMDAWFGIEFENQASNPLSEARRLFLNGVAVSSVAVPEGLTKINAYAFYNCYSISEISLPASLTDVGASAFYNSRISRISIPSVADWMEISFENIASNPISSARVLLVDGKPTSDIVIPESITEIKPFTFFQFTGISSVTIHSGVTRIGSSAFLGCSYLSAVIINDVAAWCRTEFENEDANPMSIARDFMLNGPSGPYVATSIEIPASVTAIAPYAFAGCTQLTAVTFEQGSTLKTIGTGAFKGCTNLTTIYIPDSITSIESLAFSMCPNIASYFEFGGANYLGNFNTPCLALMSLKIPEGQNESNLTSFSIPTMTKIIYQAAFSYSTKLESLVIPDSVVFIGNSAFYGCSALRTLRLGNGLTEIGNSVFSGCSSLPQLDLPESLKIIGRSAFSGCSSLTSVTLPSTLVSIDQYAFRDCSKLTSISIPASVNTIGSSAFSGCSQLASVQFANINGWSAGDTKLQASELQNPSLTAFYLTDDYLFRIWTRA